MLHILTVTFPFFALVLGGYLATRWRWLPEASIPGLNTFVLYFALPGMLFRFGAGTPISHLLDAATFGVYLVCQLVLVAFIVAASLSRRIGWNDAAFGSLVATFPNTGFMGIPLLVALLGARAAGPAMVTIVVDLVLTTSLCVALSRLGSGSAGARQAAWNAVKGVASVPMPWAICAGALFSAMDWELITPVRHTVGLLADSASPVALFSIGAVLARSQMQTATGSHAPIPMRDYLPLAGIKLLLHPVLVLLVGISAIRFGIALDRFALSVMVLVAALPSASNVSLLAEKFGANNGRIARIILVSTALAFLTFSAAVALLIER